MSAFLSPVFGAGAHLFDDQGRILANGWLYTYDANTLTPATTWTDPTQLAPNQNPIPLSSSGRTPYEIWLQSGRQYKFIVKDVNFNTVGSSYDFISGVNDTTETGQDEWTSFDIIPTYISATQFSVPGDYTTTFQVGRRIKSTVTAGTVYSTVTLSSFSTGVTTVTVRSDSGSLDSGLSVISPAFVTQNDSSFFSEGNWTPTVFGSSVAGTPTYVSQLGIYMRVGSLVHINAIVNWSAHTGSGAPYIGGLPYQPRLDASNSGNRLLGTHSNTGAPWTRPAYAPISNVFQTSNIYTFDVASATYALTGIPAAGQLHLSGTYIV